jgi:hypothetical protein
MTEVGPVVINPNGTPRRVSIMEAILHKSYVTGGVSDRRLIAVIESEISNGMKGCDISRRHHNIEMRRRSNKTIQKVKQKMMAEIGPGIRFTVHHPVFAAVCGEHGYSPYSLIGSLVKYHFVSKVGREAAPSRHYNRKLRFKNIYVINPDPGGREGEPQQ